MSREAIEETVEQSIRHMPIDDVTLGTIVEEVTNAIIGKTGGERHIVYVDADGEMTMQHPVSERFDHEGLWECNMFRRARTVAEQGAFRNNTKHLVWVDHGALMWEEVAP